MSDRDITCNFDCSDNDCDDATIDCPAGWACFVDCDGATACDNVDQYGLVHSSI